MVVAVTIIMYRGPVLKEAIESALNAEVVIENASSKKTDATFKSYEKDDWAAHYDLIIHNECTANVTDKAYVNRILEAHKMVFLQLIFTVLCTVIDGVIQKAC